MSRSPVTVDGGDADGMNFSMDICVEFVDQEN